MPDNSSPQTRPSSDSWDHGSNEEFFRYYAEQSLSEHTHRRMLALRDLLLGLLSAERGASALDVADIGCGAGVQCQLWAELGHRVHGLDVNEPLVELGRQRAAERGFDIDFHVGSAVSLPWADGSMDICLAPELLEHVVEWEACLDEFARILRPGGMLYLSTTNKLCPVQDEFDVPMYSWYPAPLKRRYERLAVTTRPELVNHAKYPAVNWFTFYGLRSAVAARGLSARDRFDVMDISDKGTLGKAAVRLIRSLPPARLLAHLVTPYTALVATKSP